MKLSQYAKQIGINYRTAWRWFKLGQIKGYQTPTGTIIITEPCISKPAEAKRNERIVIYARVSTSENKSNLDSQVERLESYCMAKGYQIYNVVKEIGSGINDERRELIKILKDPSITRIVVEHKDCLTRLGFNYIEQLLSIQQRCIEVANLSDHGKEDLENDLVAIIHSFCARLYGQRRSKRKTEKMIEELKKEE